jgi:pimeloyl-[acyl-carrier protein] synthase
VPLADRRQIKQWSDDFTRSISVPILTAELAERVQQSLQAFTDYLRPLIVQPQDHAAPSLLHQLIAAEEQGDRLSEQELVATCMLLLIAGHETTVHLIGNGMLALLRHPDQLADLQATPSLVNDAVEEMLRYDSPVQLVVRAAREDLALRGQQIWSGQAVTIVLGAANRDPVAFNDPHIFNIRRRPRQHLAFGRHIHWCLGGALARAEAQIAVTLLLERLPGLRLVTDQLQWTPTLALRGGRQLPMAWDRYGAHSVDGVLANNTAGAFQEQEYAQAGRAIESAAGQRSELL